MSQPDPSQSQPDAADAPAPLTWVATYRRGVAASLERVWENVLDWEHLPSLHARAFGSIECESAGEQGWRARVTLPGAESDPMRIALTIEEPGDRYVVRTLSGPGTGSEIWTRLTAVDPDRTDVEVRFGVPGLSAELAETVGTGYVRLYTQLWDEDEEMMVERERALRRLRQDDGARELDLGPVAELRGRLPLEVDALGRRFRVEERDGRWLAFSITCPHMLGPLAPEGDELVCPWHGYRFDPGTGRSCDGRGLRLARAPVVELSPDDRLRLRWP